MAINQNPVGGVAHITTITSTGTFTVPAGVSKVFVSIEGATGGGGGGRSSAPRYGNHGDAGFGTGGRGGPSFISGTWVGVAPGQACAVTIGAGGSASAGGPAVGGTGGTTTFDNTVSVLGSAGGPVGHGQIGAPGSASNSNTSLTPIAPAGASPRVVAYATQSTGSSVAQSTGATSRYATDATAGFSGKVHIYA
jgi:hypothetical protein